MDASLLQRIDFQKLSSYLSHDQSTIVAMLDLYLSATEKTLKSLEDAEQQKNVLLWLQACHHLKGASQNITANRMVALALEAEEIRSLPNSKTSAVLYHMHKELSLLRAAILQYCAKG
jgi:hypothetical protein